MKSVLVSLKKTMVSALALVMAASLAMPMPAMAAATKDETQTETTQQENTTGKADADGQTDAAKPIMAEIKVTNYTEGRTDAETVSGLVISDIEAPVTGKPLDQKAQVTTAEGKKWEVPVLWIDSKKQIAMGSAEKDVTYLPVVAYVVPSEYKIRNTDESGKTYTITLSEETTKLFGDTKIITLYEQTTGITYILPESIKKYLPLREEDNQYTPNNSSDDSDDESYTSSNSGDDSQPTKDDDNNADKDDKTKTDPDEEKPDEEQKEEDSALKKLVDIHCTDTVKNLFSEEELEYFADFVINKLQPQAVNLLIDSFPAFREAAEKGELGQNIGLVIDHSSTATAVGMAMTGTSGKEDNFVYKVWINTYPVAKDLDTSSPTILREGDEIVDLANTMVHEFLHIFMYDYTRAGMTGATSPSEEYYEADGKTPTAKTQATSFPQWFVEGTASAVEHNWRNRVSTFNLLRMNEDNQYDDIFKPQTFVYRYVKGVQPSGDLGEYNFDIESSSGVDKNGNTVDTLGNRYVTGYLATLYLSEMAAQHDPDLGSSIQHTDAEHIKIYSGNLKEGFNSILKRLHEGETLDAIVNDISDGRYTSADDFGAKYIKGPIDENGYYHGDTPSLNFTLTVLNYMQAIDSDKSRQYPVNGSILFEFFGDFDAPIDLDPSENETAKRYTVIDSADYVFSTVSEDTAYATGGKSISGATANTNTAISVAASGASSGASASGATSGASSGASGDNSGTLSAAAKEATPAITTAEAEAEVEAEVVEDEAEVVENEVGSEVVEDEAAEDETEVAEDEVVETEVEVAETEVEDSGEVMTEDEVVETSETDEESAAEPADEEPTSEPTDEEPVAEPASFEEPIAEPASEEETASETASEEEAMTEEADSEESADEEVSE